MLKYAPLSVAVPAEQAGGRAATERCPAVKIRNLFKSFATSAGNLPVLRDISLDIEQGERMVLLGASGCGKTTLLRCVAGLEVPDSGEIEIDGKIVFSSERGIIIPPDRRPVSMVFQSYALWPHMTVRENVGFPLVNVKTPAAEVGTRVSEALAMVGCGHLDGRFPAQLSGGQQQRIALARAVVAGERLVLFDEPLSNIDALVREQLRRELLTLQRKFGFSAIYVTHDQTEASALADRVAVMSGGIVEQLGKPEELYSLPKTRYVASFFGSTNELSGRVVSKSETGVKIETSIGILASGPVPGAELGADVSVFVRPEEIIFRPSGKLIGSVHARSFLGFYCDYEVSIGKSQLTVRSMSQDGPGQGDSVAMEIPPKSIRVFVRS